MLANGMGGLDWAGLPIVVEHLGIPDINLFLWQLRVIRSHKADRTDPPE